MSGVPAPFRFLFLLLACWVGLRVAMLHVWNRAAPMEERIASGPPSPAAPSLKAAIPRVAESGIFGPSATIGRLPVRRAVPFAPAMIREGWRQDGARLLMMAVYAGRPASGLFRRARHAGQAEAAPRAPAPLVEQRPGRWSGSAWAFLRNGRSAGLAAGGQLGGSQAGARIAYRLNRSGPVRLAAAARLSRPIGEKGAEAAAGIDWHPLPGRPLRLSAERRVRLEQGGRDAWSLYGAGGFYEMLPGAIELDGYAQAGLVGARKRDLFADGAIRIGKGVAVGKGMVLIGAGLWGAVQPGVSRLDIGPRVALRLPVADGGVTLALEGRMRVAGEARPGSGVALTLATDF